MITITWDAFFELVEIKAKTASIFPFLLGILYCLWNLPAAPKDWGSWLIFIIAAFLFNMAVDANDNYQDYRRALKNGAEKFRLETNVIGTRHLSLSQVGWLTVVLVAGGAMLGLWLVARTGWPLLWLGIFCFLVGILYAAGPWPIAGLPVGEFFSGFTMGTMIMLITVYVGVGASQTLTAPTLTGVLLASSPLAFAIGALLLANNIADWQEDLTLHRHTIVSYLGQRGGLIFWYLLYLGAAGGLMASAALHVLPLLSLLALICVPKVVKNCRAFTALPEKKPSFHLAVQNLAIISLCVTVATGLGVLFRF
ncbi:1,4-dihydroxy-2-naphthoate octaprenyltransferase [Schleiferilactobacillus harbinensis DSM 16991]|uniref:1,4-dihydroxy-2-naphthoate octaprenyltransferase n=1 Tax=Schleiferilactobacillus harbinensis DSM 16991 TaxID=1122147 RepID=A0A0R1XFH2_9LACO|nr:1,4-dihydroxy-2-naphthoate polyprenyltransferase [Schleiferilactobacillus harbinensis]KRM28357.1 1,4-dihydroxy-2-naphthoate octaprenyltransferase [Schleiferilactobacillus harbinensis DSM 16991]